MGNRSRALAIGCGTSPDRSRLEAAAEAMKWIWGGVAVSLAVAILAFALSAQLWLSQREAHHLSPPAQLSQPLRPTASEVFKLRSECVALGDKLLEADIIGTALAHDALSHYDLNTNRCYVEITVHTADLSAENPYHATYLYDGQTRQMLATLTIKKGQKSGMVYVVPPPGRSDDNGFGFTVGYIRSKMDDDRKQ
jgi:hypothetical protein